jgi:hypothetical protein
MLYDGGKRRGCDKGRFLGLYNDPLERHSAVAVQAAFEKLTVLLMEAGALHAVRLRRKSVKRTKKKIAAAVYEYQADCDGERGEDSV